MTHTELTALRESMGYTKARMARLMGIRPDDYRRYEDAPDHKRHRGISELVEALVVALAVLPDLELDTLEHTSSNSMFERFIQILRVLARFDLNNPKTGMYVYTLTHELLTPQNLDRTTLRPLSDYYYAEKTGEET